MKFIFTSFISIISFLFLWNFIPTAKECEIYNSTVRFHVIANSDSVSDQNVKLKVRDAILEEVSLYDAENKAEMLKMISRNKDELEEIAECTLLENGITSPVSLEIGEEVYPERNYEGFNLPAGEYMSVRLIIGEGKGQNWWCVLFPPMCTMYGVEYDEETYVSAGLTKEQYYMITGTSGEYEVKFKLLEIAAEAFGVEY